ncbi:MAG: hypothetical protein ACM3JH_10050 [Acidithiobacillales bacterium]
MRGPSEPLRTSLRRAATFAGLVVLFFLLKRSLLTEPGIWRGWNSDSAIFGLMANRMRSGAGFDVFFWGQGYLGTLTSALAALLRAIVLDPLGGGPASGPLALRLSCMLQVAFGIGVSFLAIERLFGYGVALVTGLFLAVSPPLLVQLSAVPNSGPEMALALGSILLFLTADFLARTPALLDRLGIRLLFGLVAGAGLWVNQTILLVLGPCLVILVLRSRTYAAALDRIHIGERTAGHAAAVRHGRRDAIRWGLPLTAGLALGYLPVWLGGLLGWYPPAYMFATSLLPERGWVARLGRFLTADGRRLVGLEESTAGEAVYAVGLAVVALHLVRHRRKLLSLFLLAPSPLGGTELLAAIVAAGAYLFTLKERLPIQLRYIAPVVPAVLALAGASALELVRLLPRKLWRTATGVTVAGAALAGLLVLSGNAERTVMKIRSEADPRPLLRRIEAEGYHVCHADYWVAYKLQFLADERIRFIPWHSFDRNRRESARLRAESGPQCLVLPDGTVRPWTASDAADEGGPRRRREAPSPPSPPSMPSTPASRDRAPSS